MVEVLSVLALATKQIKEGRFSKWPIACRSFLFERSIEKFTKKLMGESDIEAILRRLDRLTQAEARMTVAHTLEVVHGIFDSLKVVMNGARTYFDSYQATQICLNRRQSNNRQRADSSRYVPPVCVIQMAQYR